MGCGASDDSASDGVVQSQEQEQQQVDYTNIEPFAEGVKVVPISGGDGVTFPKQGDQLTMHYVGTNHGGPNHGKVFDSSRMKGRPFKFQIGMGQVIRGYDYIDVLMICSTNNYNVYNI